LARCKEHIMSIYADRARFVPVEQGFNIKRPPVPPQAFVAEMQRAFAAETATGFITLDLTTTLGTAYPATTPFMLTRYARIRKGERLACTLGATGELWAVLQGSGILERGGDRVPWRAGDVMALPGGCEEAWIAGEDAVLWVTTDEPVLAFAGARPESLERAPIEATLYRAGDIARELRALYNRPMTPETPGRALFLASERTEGLGTCLPCMTLTSTLSALENRSGRIATTLRRSCSRSARRDAPRPSVA
jgi:hypothetical protein